MALNISVSRGKTMVAGVKWSVDDWNEALLPVVEFGGLVGASELADDSITSDHLNPNFILGGVAIEDLNSPDMLMVGQDSTGDNRVITFQYFLRSIVRECTEVLNFADFYEDRMVFWRGADDLPITMGVGRFAEQLIEQAPIVTATDQDWTLMVRRATEADGVQAAQVSLRNFLPDLVTAQTVNNPTQIVVDAKGRITAISGTEGSNRFTSSETALPAGSGSANQVDIAHGLGSIPAFVQVWLKCTDAGGDGTWAQNDQIDYRSVLFDTGASDVNTPYVVRVTSTNVSLLRPAASAVTIPKKTDGTDATFDPTKWKAVVQAMR